jgi:hypothetical protein
MRPAEPITCAYRIRTWFVMLGFVYVFAITFGPVLLVVRALYRYGQFINLTYLISRYSRSKNHRPRMFHDIGLLDFSGSSMSIEPLQVLLTDFIPNLQNVVFTF